jgi:hypothetical protein
MLSAPPPGPAPVRFLYASPRTTRTWVKARIADPEVGARRSASSHLKCGAPRPPHRRHPCRGGRRFSRWSHLPPRAGRARGESVERDGGAQSVPPHRILGMTREAGRPAPLSAASSGRFDVGLIAGPIHGRAPKCVELLGYSAYTGEAEHPDRPIVNAPIGDRDRSEATLAGRSAVELALLSP